MFFITAVVIAIIIILVLPLSGAPCRGLQGSDFIKAAKCNCLINLMGVFAMVDDIISRRRNRFLLPQKSNQVAVITGGARGIGVEVVKKLLKCGMNVVIGCRNVSAGEEVVKKIREGGIIGGDVKVLQLDMESMLSVRQFADKVKAAYPKIDVLINNAGIMFAPFKLTGGDDPLNPVMESHFSVNYAGHFLLTHLLLPNLKAAGEDGIQHSRVVNVSSIAHFAGDINFKDIHSEKCYMPSAAYAQSKLAQVLFTRHLEKLFRESDVPVHVYAVHPGVCNTDLFEGTYLKIAVPWIINFIFKHPAGGATTIMFPAVAPDAESLGGSYTSNCRVCSPSAIARDDVKAKELFDFTCNLLGIENFIPQDM
ncbi:dehydrogenase/reductase SDR family member on chromosome X-like [Ischnura elegans]|uniref:dehydrogenase/reductase SDR family member on chromosome X-like n=1 Tax=Ischnura elegans TaxID=197161 RepID=UPI001ED8AE21|nr:dehydrogenase/reductase SDR family member on chromosome X-like [Ischnura elegans]